MKKKDKSLIIMTLAATSLLFSTKVAFAAVTVDPSIFGRLVCNDTNSTLSCWVNKGAMPWALGIIGTIAVVTVMAAGVMYMTSAGNPKQIELAKTLIKNALSGVAIIVLARFFLRILGTN